MSDETKPAGRKRGPKPRGEVAMSGAERNRLYRQRKRQRQAKAQGMPTPEEWQRAKRVVESVEQELVRIYNKLKFMEQDIASGDLESVGHAHADLKHICFSVAIAVGIEYAIFEPLWRNGMKIWFDPQTLLPKHGDEFPEGYSFDHYPTTTLTMDNPIVAEAEARRARAREALKKG